MRYVRCCLKGGAKKGDVGDYNIRGVGNVHGVRCYLVPKSNVYGRLASRWLHRQHPGILIVRPFRFHVDEIGVAFQKVNRVTAFSVAKAVFVVSSFERVLA